MFHLLNKNNNAFTMIEIVVATLIFAIAIAGLFAMVSNLNQPGTESFDEIQAAYIGKDVAQELQRQIDAEIWDETDPLLYNLVEGQTYDLDSVTENGITYTGNYTVTADDSGGRWVDITISW